MVDALLESELLAACASLGYDDGSVYRLEADCFETIKDLIKYLKRDDESHQIRRSLGDTKVVQTDLIPIIIHHSKNKELFDVTLRLLINMTNPVLLLFKEELPEEKITRQYFLQILSQQQEFKAAFANEKLLSVLVGYLGEILDLDWNDRDEEDRLIVERILILVRNILSAPASPEEEKRTDDDASIHDQVIWALHLARFEDLILYIASSDNEQDLCMHILEIVRLILKEQDAAKLASAGIQRSYSEKQKDEKELMEIRERESIKRREQVKKHYNARHSRFGGSYYVTNMKSISDRDLISHSHISDIKTLNFDLNKKGKKIPKNRLPVQDVNIKRRSTLAIRLCLQEFCIEFLNGAFNSLMYTVKDNLNRALAQEHDESYYLWAIEFFLQFNRAHNFKVELVTETLNLQQFHYIQTLIENYFEMMTTDKKKIPIWSRRMHCALKAYEELFMTLYFMDRSQDVSIRESSKVLKCKVFYVIEYRELILILLQNYDELKMSKTYLKDLVDTAHVILKLLEGMCGKHKHLMFQKKKKSKPKKKTVTKQAPSAPLTEDQLSSKWDEQSDALLEILNNDESDLPDVMPYDPLSDLTEEEQKENSMRKIHKFLRSGEFSPAVSLLHACCDLWPEGDVFGVKDSDAIEELTCLKTIFMANIGLDEAVQVPMEDPEDNEELDEEDILNSETPSLSEQEFSFQEFIRRFANSKVINAYCSLFKNFFNNSEHTNHCILKIFHRIAWDCKLPGMFFQASLFKVFQEILNAPPSSSLKDATNFIKHILRKFFETAQTNKKVFAELLFWKNNKEALEIEVGYGSTAEDKGAKSIKSLWKEEEEDELQRLYEEFRDSQNLEKDTVDLILDNLINKERTRRIVIKKLKELGLELHIKRSKTATVRAPKQWLEEEEEELKMLYAEHKESLDPVSRIIDHMLVKRPKPRVIEKMLELGLVQDRKELRKKRPKKARNDSRKNTGEAFLEANNSSDSDSEISEDDDDEQESNSEDDSSTKEERIPSNAPKVKTPILTPENIKNALVKVSQGGHAEAVQWMVELLNETASDREEDGDFEPIPILAITAASMNAMEDDSFKELLSLIGLQAPLREQEMFWRIPSCLSVNDLRKRSQFLLQGLNDDQESSDSAFNLINGKENEPLEGKEVIKSPICKDRQVLAPLDIENNPKYNNKVKINNSKTEINAKKKRINPVIDSGSDSDDDHPMSRNALPKNDNENVRKRAFISSDDDDDDNESLNTSHRSFAKKPRAIIISDDSDDE